MIFPRQSRRGWFDAFRFDRTIRGTASAYEDKATAMR